MYKYWANRYLDLDRDRLHETPNLNNKNNKMS